MASQLDSNPCWTTHGFMGAFEALTNSDPQLCRRYVIRANGLRICRYKCSHDFDHDYARTPFFLHELLKRDRVLFCANVRKDQHPRKCERVGLAVNWCSRDTKKL